MDKKNNTNGNGQIKKYMMTKIPVVSETDTIESILKTLEKDSTSYETVDYIYVNNVYGELIGVVSIHELFNNPKETPITKFMKKPISVTEDANLEKIAHVGLKNNLKQIPIVDSKKLLGVISSQKVTHAINKILKENMFRTAGIDPSHMDYENSLEIPIFKVIKDRLYWLIFGLAGAMIIAVYITSFETMLQQYVIIASFVPAIVYMSSALGNQLQTIFVRDLAIMGKEINLKKYFTRQILVSITLALIIATIMFSTISILWSVQHIAFIIAMASFVSIIITGINSLLITLIIKHFKFDPAIGSGPVATIISDMTSIIIYFIVATQLL